jgi:hypothetical protein
MSLIVAEISRHLLERQFAEDAPLKRIEVTVSDSEFDYAMS